MPKEDIITLSRSSHAQAHYTEPKKAGDGRMFPDLYEAISAGCLQRIANSLEILTDNSRLILKVREQQRIIDEQSKALWKLKGQLKESDTYKLQKQITKLSARLKKAGLDGDPTTDNRSKAHG